MAAHGTESEKSFVNYVLPRMRDDGLKSVVKEDELILLYGERQYCKHMGNEDMVNVISQKTRQLARLVEKQLSLIQESRLYASC